MREDSWSAYLLYLPISILVLLTRILPVNAVLNFGVFFGTAAYYIHIKRRRIANANLKAAYGKMLSWEKRKKIIIKMFKNFGLNIMELFLMPRMSDNYFGKYVKVRNIERVKKALAEKKGIVFLSAHYGNWELCASISAHYGYKMHALARVQKPYLLNYLLNHSREVRGTKVIQKGMQLREIVKNLKQNGIVGMIGDQSGRAGQLLDLFGRPVFIAEGAFRIAGKTGSPILPAFNLRHGKGFNHELVIEEPIQIREGEDIEEFVKRGAAKYSEVLERHIRKKPHLWLWGNRRWKYTSARTVLILKDGKTGHLRQAQAVARCVFEQTSPVKAVELDVVFKSHVTEKMLNLAALLFGRIIRNPMRYLEMALTADSFNKLEAAYADIIVCTGSSTRAAGLLLAKENLAKTVCLMKPAPFSERDFDLSIIPYHDQARAQKNVVMTHGALNMVSPVCLAEAKEQLGEYAELKKGLKIGVLIGGDSKYYSLDVGLAEKLIEELKKFADEHNAEILLSTSRRTPNNVDEYIKKSLKNYPRCIFKVFPNEKNYDFAVNGILGAADVVVVTGESISMVSEAAAADVYTIVLALKKKSAGRKTKHEKFIDHLEKEKIVRIAHHGAFYDELTNFKKGAFSLVKLDDNEKLNKAIQDKIL
ncbi:MAG: mitochondrial fission ELM1 family protein [Candidatus Omnitrophica bacterium]|nr:mitochondrial fission ELM1 family protein [Candidatus Omnitrophota bacterium]